jgi:hypothetical protein
MTLRNAERQRRWRESRNEEAGDARHMYRLLEDGTPHEIARWLISRLGDKRAALVATAIEKVLK